MKIWKILVLMVYLKFVEGVYVLSVSLSETIPKWNNLLCLGKIRSTYSLFKKEKNGSPQKLEKVKKLRKMEKNGKERKPILYTIHNFLIRKKNNHKATQKMFFKKMFNHRHVEKTRWLKLSYLIKSRQERSKRSNIKRKISKNNFQRHYMRRKTKKTTKSFKIRMILAPKGSIHEQKTEEILSDPIKNYPWEITIPFHETLTCEQNPYYNFLKSEWAYLDHRKDKRKLCGKLEGGLENYDGKGLKLEGGVDRPRYKKIPYYLDHGVEWRKFNADEMIRFDMDPDGNQDQTFLETEEDLEYRQWGNWNYNNAKETTQLNTAWRDPVLSKDLSNLIYPWSHKAHENHVIPLGYTGPTGFTPEIPVEWELAARGFFSGYFDDPNWDRIKCYRTTKKLIIEWHELEQAKRQIEKRLTNERNKKRTKQKKNDGNMNMEKNMEKNMENNMEKNIEKNMDPNNSTNDNKNSHNSNSSNSDNSKADLKEIERINNRIAKIRMELFGVSSRKKYTSKQIKLINEHALFRAKEMILDYILVPNHDPDYHLYYLDRHEPMDYIGGGSHNCSEKEIKNKTIVLNMCIHPLKPQYESYSLNMSVEEMAEMYHYFMTEIRGEGRVHNLFEEPTEPKYLCYELKKERKKFPTLVALYKPLWTNKMYGEEFGDALQRHEKLQKLANRFTNFNRQLKTKPKEKVNKKEMEQYNFVNDYEHFDEQYDL